MQKEEEQKMEQRLLGIAEQLFMHKGFAGTSTSEIARQAGCNQALVHYYFRTKERLFLAIFQKKLQALVYSLFHEVDQGLPFRERLKKRIRLHLDFLDKNAELPAFVLHELLSNSARLELFKENMASIPSELYQNFVQEVKEEIAAGRIRPIEPLDLVFTAVSLNVMLYISAPLSKALLANGSPELFQSFLKHRQEENIRTIMALLEPVKGDQR